MKPIFAFGGILWFSISIAYSEVSPVNYHGWDRAHQMSNGDATLGLVPQT